jgi:hypothetical protein
MTDEPPTEMAAENARMAQLIAEHARCTAALEAVEGHGGPVEDAARSAYREASCALIDARHAERDALRQQLDEIRSVISDPVAVHLNIMRGTIARPSDANLWHLLGTNADTMRQRCERMERALRKCEQMMDRGTYGDAYRLVVEVREALAPSEREPERKTGEAPDSLRALARECDDRAFAAAEMDENTSFMDPSAIDSPEAAQFIAKAAQLRARAEALELNAFRVPDPVTDSYARAAELRAQADELERARPAAPSLESELEAIREKAEREGWREGL